MRSRTAAVAARHTRDPAGFCGHVRDTRCHRRAPPGPRSTRVERRGQLRVLNELGRERCAVVGNGANDVAVLEAAALGFVVLGPEGASAAALRSPTWYAPPRPTRSTCCSTRRRCPRRCGRNPDALVLLLLRGESSPGWPVRPLRAARRGSCRAVVRRSAGVGAGPPGRRPGGTGGPVTGGASGPVGASGVRRAVDEDRDPYLAVAALRSAIAIAGPDELRDWLEQRPRATVHGPRGGTAGTA